MYPLIEETTAWQKGDPSLLSSYEQFERSLACLTMDESLEGVAFIFEGGDWKVEKAATGDTNTYSMVVPRYDILEAVLCADTVGSETHNPRLVVKPPWSSDVVNTIVFGEELGLPMMGAFLTEVRLFVDATQSTPPKIRFRYASLRMDKRQACREEMFWRGLRIF